MPRSHYLISISPIFSIRSLFAIKVFHLFLTMSLLIFYCKIIYIIKERGIVMAGKVKGIWIKREKGGPMEAQQ